MESAIGALGSPDDVFKQRYVNFIDNLMPDTSSIAFALLAAYTDRLTPEMFRSVQPKIQTKIVEASRLDSSEGIVFFAWNVLKNHPKVLSHNQEAFRKITWKALERAFVERFVENNPSNDSVLKLPFPLFAKVYGDEWKLITSTIVAVAKKKPPYKQDIIMDLSIINEYGGTKKYELLYFLWSLLESVILHCPKGIKLNVEYILKVAENTFYCKNENATKKVFGTLITLSKMIRNNFAVYIDRLFSIIQAFSIPPKILHRFLIELLGEQGSLLENAEIFPQMMLKFVETFKVKDARNDSAEDYIIGRSESAAETFQSFDGATQNQSDGDYEGLFDLAICILETIPSSIPVPYIKNIQQEFCTKIIESTNPSINDLKMLNALLAIRNEEILSPVSAARTIYSWSLVYKNPQLAPYIKIGRALCDVQRSLRCDAFDLLPKESEISALNENKNTIVAEAPKDSGFAKKIVQEKAVVESPKDASAASIPEKPSATQMGQDAPVLKAAEKSPVTKNDEKAAASQVTEKSFVKEILEKTSASVDVSSVVKNCEKTPATQITQESPTIESVAKTSTSQVTLETSVAETVVTIENHEVVEESPATNVSHKSLVAEVLDGIQSDENDIIIESVKIDSSTTPMNKKNGRRNKQTKTAGNKRDSGVDIEIITLSSDESDAENNAAKKTSASSHSQKTSTSPAKTPEPTHGKRKAQGSSDGPQAKQSVVDMLKDLFTP